MSALREGYTTGTCAAAAAKAAAMILTGSAAPATVDVPLPDGGRLTLPVDWTRLEGEVATAAVVKDAGDDPDVTNGALITASVVLREAGGIRFAAGEGVGTVSKPGLAIPPGEPAINPVPRRMIIAALREVTARDALVTVSIPGGKELAGKTFNPRLGIEDGLSILGTSGRVRPFSCEAIRCSVLCALEVAQACGVRTPVLVPGRIGWRAARGLLQVTDEQVIEAGNDWGFLLDRFNRYGFERLLILGHPGKLAKLAAGDWDTHSSRSGSPLPIVSSLAETILGRPLTVEGATTEGLFLRLAGPERRSLADALSARIARAVADRLGVADGIAVMLVDMRGELLGSYGDSI